MAKPSSRTIPTDPEEYQRCVTSVKSKVKRWPSAYASGMVQQMYKRVMAQRKRPAFVGDRVGAQAGFNLTRWFAEKWVDIVTGKPCGATRRGTSSSYPTCRPTVRVSSRTPRLLSDLSAAQIRRMVAQKQVARTKTVRYTYAHEGKTVS